MMKVHLQALSFSSISILVLALTAFSLDAPVAAQDGTDKTAGKKLKVQDENPWQNKKRTQRGSAALNRIYEAAGGLEEWDKLDGIRMDLLETWRVMTDLETKEIKVHHRTPRLCWFTPDGDGYILSEHVGSDGVKADYRREVSIGSYSWAEASGQSFRQPDIVAKANNSLDSFFFLSCMPLSLSKFGAEMIFLRELNKENSLYGIRLARPLVIHAEEEISNFVAIVENKTNRIVRLDYSLTGIDRMTGDPRTRCQIRFEGTKPLGNVTIANKYHWSFQLLGNTREYWVEDIVNSTVPPEALRRPWQVGSLYQSDVRADFFDPPAEEEPEAPEGKGEGDSKDK
ncbi:MAG: hypothetical protein P8N31_13805 [Planctomycetota bacterium]|nr:hypothetical protein [Planctomycetota bacterium]MDG2144621.1 hypothetical protein [Planctomycetota bacterium]